MKIKPSNQKFPQSPYLKNQRPTVLPVTNIHKITFKALNNPSLFSNQLHAKFSYNENQTRFFQKASLKMINEERIKIEIEPHKKLFDHKHKNMNQIETNYGNETHIQIKNSTVSEAKVVFQNLPKIKIDEKNAPKTKYQNSILIFLTRQKNDSICTFYDRMNQLNSVDKKLIIGNGKIILSGCNNDNLEETYYERKECKNESSQGVVTSSRQFLSKMAVCRSEETKNEASISLVTPKNQILAKTMIDHNKELKYEPTQSLVTPKNQISLQATINNAKKLKNEPTQKLVTSSQHSLTKTAVYNTKDFKNESTQKSVTSKNQLLSKLKINNTKEPRNELMQRLQISSHQLSSKPTIKNKSIQGLINSTHYMLAKPTTTNPILHQKTLGSCPTLENIRLLINRKILTKPEPDEIKSLKNQIGKILQPNQTMKTTLTGDNSTSKINSNIWMQSLTQKTSSFKPKNPSNEGKMFGSMISSFFNSKTSLFKTLKQSEKQPKNEENNGNSSFTLHLLKVLERLTERQNDYGFVNICNCQKFVLHSQNGNFYLDFIVQTCEKAKFKERVTFLSIELFYFSLRLKNLTEIDSSHLALTSIWMASKFEDAWAPVSNPFYQLKCIKDSKELIIKIEAEIFKGLDFNMNLVLVYDFFGIFSSLIGLSKDHYNFGVYVVNSLLYFNHCQRTNKKLLAFCVCKLVCKVFDLVPFWNENLIASKKYVGLKIVNNKFQQNLCEIVVENVKNDFVFEQVEVEDVFRELDLKLRMILTKNSEILIKRYSTILCEEVSRFLRKSKMGKVFMES